MSFPPSAIPPPTFFKGLEDFLQQPFPLAVLGAFISTLVGGFAFRLSQWIIAEIHRKPAEAPCYVSEDSKAIRAAVYEALADLGKRTAKGEPVVHATVIKLPHGYEVEVRATAGCRKEGGKETKATAARIVPE